MKKLIWLLVIGAVLLTWMPAAHAESRGGLGANGRVWDVYVLGDRDKAEDVPYIRAIQYLLRARGYTVTIDGYYGPQTASKVASFQRAHGLPASGAMTGSTWEALIPTLREGDRGSAVYALQILLRASGAWGKPAVDGYLGPQTVRIVESLQRDFDITPAGLVGPRTWNALVEYNDDSD